MENKIYRLIERELNIIKEASDNDLDFFNKTEHVILDMVTAGDYEVLLIKHNPTGTIQIGLTSKNNDFTSPESQLKKNDTNNDPISSWRKIGEKILEWSQEYPDIKVGSYNHLKTRKYHNILKKIIPNVSGIRNYGSFCFFEILNPMNENKINKLIEEQLKILNRSDF